MYTPTLSKKTCLSFFHLPNRLKTAGRFRERIREVWRLKILSETVGIVLGPLKDVIVTLVCVCVCLCVYVCAHVVLFLVFCFVCCFLWMCFVAVVAFSSSSSSSSSLLLLLLLFSSCSCCSCSCCCFSLYMFSIRHESKDMNWHVRWGDVERSWYHWFIYMKYLQ